MIFENFDIGFFRALTLYGYYVSLVLSAVSTVCNHGGQLRGTPGSELLRAPL